MCQESDGKIKILHIQRNAKKWFAEINYQNRMPLHIRFAKLNLNKEENKIQWLLRDRVELADYDNEE